MLTDRYCKSQVTDFSFLILVQSRSLFFLTFRSQFFSISIMCLYRKTTFVFIFLISFFTVAYGQTPPLELSNKKASKQARALYSYLQDMYGKKTLSGQMVSNFGGVDELKYIQDVTGKQPAIRGMDFIDSAKNEDEVQFAKEWWKKRAASQPSCGIGEHRV